MNDIYSQVYDICKSTPTDTLEKICMILEKSNELNSRQIIVEINSSLPSGRYIDKLQFLLTECESKNIKQSSTISNAIRSLSYATSRFQDELVTEIVWTGPQVKGAPLRPTATVLSEIISGAKYELIIVSFVVYKVPDVARKIKDALDRGVVVTFIVESVEDSDGRMNYDGIDSLGLEIIRRSRILYWPKEKREEFSPDVNSSLHVKCAIADDDDILISSANLTKNALKHNMEMGLRVTNKALATRVKSHFKELIHAGILVQK